MHYLGLTVFSLIVLFWFGQCVNAAISARELPRLKEFEAAADTDCPTVSILFAARDEAEKLPTALETLRQIDYPQLEIIAVNDRSSDGTARILQDAAQRDPRLKIASIEALPEGWLGKPHALQRGFEICRSEWLLFTDADVRFQPDVIRKAITLANEKRLDHLTLLCELEMRGFWEKTALTFFGLSFNMATNPRAVSNPASRAYMGIGAFQMVKRDAYEKSGMHQRLAMEVLDDMKLGKIVKLAGFRSGVGVAQDYIAVRWHAGFGNVVRGVTKNFFAVAEYKLWVVAVQLTGLFMVNILPFVGLLVLRGWEWWLALISALMAIAYHAAAARVMKISFLYGLTHPLGAVIFAYMLVRSTVVTLRQGGIVWRDTFYPLDQLRKGVV
jgi:glycosyltransferase involved in cell wall biosynthesis